MIPSNAATPTNLKKSMLIQEGLHCMINHFLASMLEDAVEAITLFNIVLYNSGYTENFCFDVSNRMLSKFLSS